MKKRLEVLLFGILEFLQHQSLYQGGKTIFRSIVHFILHISDICPLKVSVGEKKQNSICSAY